MSLARRHRDAHPAGARRLRRRRPRTRDTSRSRFLTMRNVDGRYGPPARDGRPRDGAPPTSSTSSCPRAAGTIAPLLASVEPDLVVCMGFPWKIPPDALAVPRLGWLNGHPSLLPRHRGPLPVAWAIREGDEEIGITFHLHGRRARHRADPRPAAVSARRARSRRTRSIPSSAPPSARRSREALEKLAAGEEGTPQPEGGGYETFFSEEDAWLDLSRPAAEVHRLAWAWRYAISLGGTRGALLELDGTTVRVLATSLTEVEGARAARLRRRAALDRRDGGAQRGRGHAVHRSGSIHAVTRRASRLWNGLPE